MSSIGSLAGGSRNPARATPTQPTGVPTGVFSQKVGCWPRLPLAHQLALSLPVLALSAALHHLAGQPSWHSPHGTSSHDAHGGHAHDTLGGDTDGGGMLSMLHPNEMELSRPCLLFPQT